jgi:hypothetical protein
MVFRIFAWLRTYLIVRVNFVIAFMNHLIILDILTETFLSLVCRSILEAQSKLEPCWKNMHNCTVQGMGKGPKLFSLNCTYKRFAK